MLFSNGSIAVWQEKIPVPCAGCMKNVYPLMEKAIIKPEQPII
jgi:hypothetical protein